MFTVIIPTMWRGLELATMLPILDFTELVGEIIIINNDQLATPRWFFSSQWKKVRVETPPSNIYVNPAFNLGVSISKFEKIALQQDDILFDANIFNLLHDKVTPNVGPIGCHYKQVFKTQEIYSIKTIQAFPFSSKLNIGWSMLMFFHKANWFPISEDLKIHLGEEWIVQYHIQKKKLYPIALDGFKLSTTKYSATSGLPHFQSFYDSEHNKQEWIKEQISKII